MKRIIKPFSFTVLLTFVLISFSGCRAYDKFSDYFYRLVSTREIYMFENISEFESMEDNFKEYGQIQKYDPSYDESLNGLEYVNQYLAKYECENYEFEIFAYEFQMVEQAQQYYSNHGNETSQAVTRWYINSSGKITIITLNEKNIYKIKYQKQDEEAITELLSQKLALEMIVVKDEVIYHFECIENVKYKDNE